jgi:hypothetical protein
MEKLAGCNLRYQTSDSTNQAVPPSSSEKTVLLANLHERVAGTTQLASSGKFWQVPKLTADRLRSEDAKTCPPGET